MENLHAMEKIHVFMLSCLKLASTPGNEASLKFT